MHVTDRETFRSVTMVLAVLETVKSLYGSKLELHADYFDKVMGTSNVREAFLRGVPYKEIVAGWDKGLEEFAAMRGEFLLYR